MLRYEVWTPQSIFLRERNFHLEQAPFSWKCICEVIIVKLGWMRTLQRMNTQQTVRATIRLFGNMKEFQSQLACISYFILYFRVYLTWPGQQTANFWSVLLMTRRSRSGNSQRWVIIISRSVTTPPNKLFSLEHSSLYLPDRIEFYLNSGILFNYIFPGAYGQIRTEVVWMYCDLAHMLRCTRGKGPLERVHWFGSSFLKGGKGILVVICSEMYWNLPYMNQTRLKASGPGTDYNLCSQLARPPGTGRCAVRLLM